MRSLAEAGFSGAASAQEQALKGYGDASSSFTSLAAAQKAAETEMGGRYADDLTKTRLTQAGLDRDYAGQLIDRYRAQTESSLGEGQLREAGRGHDIESTIARNQFNVEAGRSEFGRWQQEQQAQMEMARLREQARQFDVGRGDTNRQFDVTQAEQQREFDKQNALGFADVNARQLPAQLQAGRPRVGGPAPVDNSAFAQLSRSRDTAKKPSQYSWL